MSVTPETLNITLWRRSDYALDLTFQDTNNNPINLTGSTVVAQAWDIGRSQKYADFTITYTNRAQGEVKIELSDTQTAAFPDTLYYDVLVIDSNDLRNYYLSGRINVNEGYSS